VQQTWFNPFVIPPRSGVFDQFDGDSQGVVPGNEIHHKLDQQYHQAQIPQRKPTRALRFLRFHGCRQAEPTVYLTIPEKQKY